MMKLYRTCKFDCIALFLSCTKRMMKLYRTGYSIEIDRPEFAEQALHHMLMLISILNFRDLDT